MDVFAYIAMGASIIAAIALAGQAAYWKEQAQIWKANHEELREQNEQICEQYLTTKKSEAGRVSPMPMPTESGALREALEMLLHWIDKHEGIPTDPRHVYNVARRALMGVAAVSSSPEPE